jgi:GrpB-like predicted nucleotidyltransferase (UPF0157 family)
MADPVRIVPYDPAWPGLFAQLGAALRTALGAAALRIDHVGSTSVPSLDAKPVIDVQVSVASLAALDSYRIPLESIGYLFRADNPDLSKRYFRETPGQRRTHVHVRQAGSWSEQGTLLFRDYLRAHLAQAQQYAALKYRLAEQYRDERQRYTEAKDPFIWEILRKANLWSQEVGWQPGPTDA